VINRLAARTVNERVSCALSQETESQAGQILYSTAFQTVSIASTPTQIAVLPWRYIRRGDEHHYVIRRTLLKFLGHLFEFRSW